MNWSSDYGIALILLPVYCNSLLGTLNVRNAIRGRGHGNLGISLNAIEDSDPSATGSQQVDGLVGFPHFTVAHLQPLAEEIEMKAEIVEYIEGSGSHGYITGLEARSQDGNSPLPRPGSYNDPRPGVAGCDLKPRRPRHLRRASF